MAVATSLPPRPLRGSRISSFYPPLPVQGPSISTLDSAFQLQEYISLLIRRNPHDVETIVSIPEKPRASGSAGSEEAGEKEGKPEFSVDESCWIYEQLRRLAQDLNHPLITSLQEECTRATCPEMKAGEWLYLCVAHGNDGAMEQCCAIDYVLHTLDSATALLNSPRTFPSRITIPPTSVRHFSSLPRRLGRIFAHAYFHHREAFEQAEAESSLYARFLALTSKFNLVPAEYLVIPPRMSASQSSSSSGSSRDGGEADPPRLFGLTVDPVSSQEEREGDNGGSSGADALSEQVDSDPDFSRRSLSPEKPPTALQGSPRKFGRNRTDTMILSDAQSFTEELRSGFESMAAGIDNEPKPQSTKMREVVPEPATHEREQGGEVMDIADADTSTAETAIPTPSTSTITRKEPPSEELDEAATPAVDDSTHQPEEPQVSGDHATIEIPSPEDVVAIAEAQVEKGEVTLPSDVSGPEVPVLPVEEIADKSSDALGTETSSTPSETETDGLEQPPHTPDPSTDEAQPLQSSCTEPDLASHGEGDVGPGGFVMLGEATEVCIADMPSDIQKPEERHPQEALPENPEAGEEGIWTDLSEEKPVDAAVPTDVTPNPAASSALDTEAAAEPHEEAAKPVGSEDDSKKVADKPAANETDVNGDDGHAHEHDADKTVDGDLEDVEAALKD